MTSERSGERIQLSFPPILRLRTVASLLVHGTHECAAAGSYVSKCLPCCTRLFGFFLAKYPSARMYVHIDLAHTHIHIYCYTPWRYGRRQNEIRVPSSTYRLPVFCLCVGLDVVRLMHACRAEFIRTLSGGLGVAIEAWLDLRARVVDVVSDNVTWMRFCLGMQYARVSQMSRANE